MATVSGGIHGDDSPARAPRGAGNSPGRPEEAGILVCRHGCGACCIAPSITSSIPGMPEGKPAGVRCVQLTANLRCILFGRPERPAVCSSLQPAIEMCGRSAEEAMRILAALEAATGPNQYAEDS
jgi:Fe-S-cluster containining protein